MGRALLGAVRWLQHRRVRARDHVFVGPEGRRTPWLEAGQPDLGTVVWLHGFSDRRDAILPTVAHARGVRWLAPALPGFHDGWRDPDAPHTLDAYVAWLKPVLDHITEGPFVLAGNSLGGAAALALAAAWPERIRGVVALNSAGLSLEGVPSVTEEIEQGSSPFFIRSAEDLQSLFGRIMGQPVQLPGLVEAALLEEFRGQADWYQRLGQDLAESTIHAEGPGWRAGIPLRKVQAPTLVLWGDRDLLFPFLHGQRLADLLPDARLQRMPGTGHCAHLQHPRRLAQHIESFVQSVGRAAV